MSDFHAPRKDPSFVVHPTINNILLNGVTYIRYLGVTVIDGHLSWSKHINNVRVAKNIEIISRILLQVNTKIAILLNLSLIYLYLTSVT